MGNGEKKIRNKNGDQYEVSDTHVFFLVRGGARRQFECFQSILFECVHATLLAAQWQLRSESGVSLTAPTFC